jgi:tRNA dimethylallyltransferase
MILAIVGPTGTGKSDLSLALAQRWREAGRELEIVNADAMQLYRGMNIGTAKLPLSEREGIPHHLIDVLDVTEEASVARYQEDARRAIDDITARGATALLVGGSGLYVAAVLSDFRFPGTDPERRAHWEAALAQRGAAALHEELERRDAPAAEAIGPHNGRRLVRALEVGDLTGQPFSAGLGARERPWRPYRQVGLSLDRAALVPRLEARVDGMWRAGLLDEVRALVPYGLERGVTASRAIGYAQAMGQLAGRLSEPQAIAETQVLTRRFARRQVSWFKRDETVRWVDVGADAGTEGLLDQVANALAPDGVDSMAG